MVLIYLAARKKMGLKQKSKWYQYLNYLKWIKLFTNIFYVKMNNVQCSCINEIIFITYFKILSFSHTIFMSQVLNCTIATNLTY